MDSRFARLFGGPLIDEFREMRRDMIFDALLQRMLQDMGPLGQEGFAGGGAPTMTLALVGQLLGAARAARRRSLRELATETGIDNTTIGRIERGQANPTIGILQRLAEALGKELRVSLVDVPKEKTPADAGGAKLAPNGACSTDSRPAGSKTAEQLADDLMWNSFLGPLPQLEEQPPLPSLDELFGTGTDPSIDGLG